MDYLRQPKQIDDKRSLDQGTLTSCMQLCTRSRLCHFRIYTRWDYSTPSLSLPYVVSKFQSPLLLNYKRCLEIPDHLRVQNVARRHQPHLLSWRMLLHRQHHLLHHLRNHILKFKIPGPKLNTRTIRDFLLVWRPCPYMIHIPCAIPCCDSWIVGKWGNKRAVHNCVRALRLTTGRHSMTHTRVAFPGIETAVHLHIGKKHMVLIIRCFYWWPTPRRRVRSIKCLWCFSGKQGQLLAMGSVVAWEALASTIITKRAPKITFLCWLSVIKSCNAGYLYQQENEKWFKRHLRNYVV